MNFAFTEEQLLFRKSVSELLRARLSPEHIRTLWSSDTGRDAALWQEFANLGLLGMCAPEDCNGLALRPVDFVLIAEECGYAALPDPLVDTVLVTVPLLASAGDKGAEILAQLISGKARVSVGNRYDTLVDDLHVSDWALLPAKTTGEMHLLAPKDLGCRLQPSIDPSRRLFSIDWRARAATCVDRDAAQSWSRAHNMGALGAAAQLLGVTQKMLDLAVAYTAERKQFSKPIGSFQALKHMLADVAILLEFARPVVYHAAMVLSEDPSDQLAVAHAKIAASQAVSLALKNCFQAHGAMGYTWEMDLQIWMKRAWALDKYWGASAVHKQHVHDALVSLPEDPF